MTGTSTKGQKVTKARATDKDVDLNYVKDAPDLSSAVAYPCDAINIAGTELGTYPQKVAFMFSYQGGDRASFPVPVQVAERIYKELGAVLSLLKSDIQ